ncbi:MAG: polyprenyl synthetase family protein [Treponema sp.]|jgi:octaprenyl-diphosphate synthase|nr:polyprenyl synthetase family protein [Treponema sp.]
MEREYTLRVKKIEEALSRALPRRPGQEWLEKHFPGLELDPALVNDLVLPGRELLDRGGKRWRPLLSLLVCETFGGNDAVLPLLPLVEFPHNASLIHDDIEDNSEQRRGKPAIHLLFGNDTAINSGCFLYFLPLACIEAWDAPAEAKNGVWSLWAEHMRRLHLGQSMDIAWHRDFYSLPSIDEYLLMCRLKTGCLARFAAFLGAFCSGGCPEAAAERCGTAAEKLGVGFQILDDVKNLSSGVPGKERGDDIVEGKKSLPVLLFLHGRDKAGCPARPAAGRAAFAASCFKAAREKGAGAAETAEFIEELERAGVIEEARQRGETLIGEAKAAFGELPEAAGLPPENEAAGLLAGFTELLR